MENLLLFLFIISYNFNIIYNYILIPFDIFISNPCNNNNYQNDLLSMKFCEDIYINLTLGNPEQMTKMLLRVDQYEIIIKESIYKSELSNSFILNKFIEDKFICNETFNLFTINNTQELKDFIYKGNRDIEGNKYKIYQNVKFVYINKTNYNYLENEEFKDVVNIILVDNYGILGLNIPKSSVRDSPEFIKSIKEIKRINASIFTFIFNNNKKNNHYGYLIIGDKYIDKEKEYEETNST